jgi:flagellar M-ring protein FliF
MESLKRALEQIGRMWAGLGATQRVVLSAGAVIMAVLLIFGSVSTTESWVRVAGPDADGGAILKKLQERSQKHEVRGDGIYVPKADANRVVMDLRGEGSMSDGDLWKFLDQPNILATRWDKEKRLQMAVQSRIEGMIRSIDGVQDAHLMINPGSTNFQSGFFGPKPSAAVTVKLRDGMTLNQKNVQAIAGLVARSVTGVEEDLVHIVDGRGNAYRARKADDNARDVADIREYERVEESRILTSIKDAFSSITSSGISVVVRIKATTKSSDTESVVHDKPVVIESDEENRTVRKGDDASVGVRKGPDAEPAAPSSGGAETFKRVHEKNVVGSTKKTERNPAGDIERITVGVLIPVEEGPRLAEAQRNLPALQNFVLKAAGPQARAEDVSVQLIPTKPMEVAAAAVETSGAAATWIAANWIKVLLGAFAFVAFVVIVRVIQTNSAKDTVEELQALTTALSETREAQGELGLPGEGDVTRLKQGLQDMVGRNPEGVAASLKSFMSGR